MIDIHMFYVNVDTARFTTSCGFDEDVPKPVLVHTERILFDVAFRHNNGTPFDLTGAHLTAAWDNNFIHTDSLVASTSDVTVLDAENGVARFSVQCSSTKFAQLVYSRPTEVKMQIVYYSAENVEGNSILRDGGVVLCPRVATTEGAPEQDDPEYYNKAQVDALLETYVQTFTEMPAPSGDYVGNVIVYSGEDGEYLQGHSYKCLETGGSFIWYDITPGVNLKDYVKHSDELPEASELYDGWAYLYTGQETEELHTGHTYVCIEDQNEEYVWVDVTPAPDLSNCMRAAESLPEASSEYAGQVYVYVGDGNLEYGQKYRCVAGVGGAYSWVRLADRVDSVNGYTGAVVLDNTDVGAMKFDGLATEVLTGGTIPGTGKIYKCSPQENITFTFPTPVEDSENLFELDITMPDPAVTVELPQGIVWKFAAPTLTAGTTTAMRFRYTESGWEGWATPDMSQYALAADYVPKTGGTFSGQVTIAPPANFSGRRFVVNDATYGEMFFVDRWSLGCGHWPVVAGIYGSMAIGEDASATGGWGCSVIGRYVKNSIASSTLVGSFGTMPADAKFAVANGASSAQQNICFSVLNTGDVVSTNSIISAGSVIRQLSAESGVVNISIQQGAAYTYTLIGNETITLGTPTTGYCPTIELWLTQPATAVSFSLGTTVLWNDGSGNFSSGNPAPAMDTGNRTYCLVFRWTGSVWLCNLAYTVEVSA